MADRQDKAIPIGPDRIVGIKTQKALPQAIDHRGHGHGRARVTGACLLNRIHRQRSDRVDTQCIDLLFPHHDFTLLTTLPSLLPLTNPERVGQSGKRWRPPTTAP